MSDAGSGIQSIIGSSTADQEESVAASDATPQHNTVSQRSGLDHRIAISAQGWFGLVSAIAVIVAIALRFTQLDIYTLTQTEGRWAYQSWALFLGKDMPSGDELSTVSPVFLVLQALTFFLFGVTDAVARIIPALAGVGIVALIFLLRPFVSRFAIAGAAVLAAISPSLVFASRSSDPVILVGFFSLLFVVAILRAGLSEAGRSRSWAALAGFAFAATLASGPEGVTALIGIGIALLVGSITEAGKTDADRGAIAQGIHSFSERPGNLITAGIVAVVGVVVFFTRVFSEFGALSGLPATFADWGRLIATRTSTTPVQFFFYSTLLYEILAVVFAIVAVTAGRPKESGEERIPHELRPVTLGTWFIVVLLLQSLSSGRQPDQLSIVTLPLLLLGGLGLGAVLERIPWSRLTSTTAGVVPLAIAGVLIGLIATFVLIARSNDPAQSGKSFIDIALPILFVLIVVVAPLAYLLSGEFRTRAQKVYIGWSTLLVIAALLLLYTINSTTALAYHRADSGLEPAAQGTSTTGLRAFVNQTKRLSRDLTVRDVSNIDNTGSYGLSIAIAPEVEWPYLWYFRDFYDLRVTSPAGWGDADLVIAASPEGMEDAGYVVQSKNAFNRVPTSYEEMSAGTIFSHIFNPGKWYEGIRFLLFRDIASDPVPSTASVGYTFELSNQINPSLGPFDLTEDVGSGSGLGQLNTPVGVALSPDGSIIYVVDSLNQRVQRYDQDGTFLGVWDVNSDPALDFGSQYGQGPQGITTDENGLVYVADTWNHRVVVIDTEGNVVRELGQKGTVADNADSADPNVDTGRFYGPRAVAVADGEIYVVDTGNERVQVFATDGTFLRTFGGYGTDAGKLIEPTGIAIGPDGNVYVADSGNGRLSVFTKDGTLVQEIAVPQWVGQVDRENFLAFGTNGLLYSTLSSTGEIIVFNPTTGEQVYAGNGDFGRIMVRPLGIAVAPDGTVFVADASESRVDWFTLDLPEITTVATPHAATPATDPTSTGEATPAP